MAGEEITVLADDGTVVRGARCVVGAAGVSRAREVSVPWTSDESALSNADPSAENSDDSPGAFAQAALALADSKPVVAVPLSRVMARILTVPEAAREDVGSFVSLQMENLFPPAEGEEVSVQYEVLCETEQGMRVFAATLPITESERLAAIAETAGIHPARLDVAALGWYRTICANNADLSTGCVAAVLAFSDVPDLIVLQDGVPVFIRSLGETDPEAISREVMLSLIEAEHEVGASTEGVRAVIFTSSDTGIDVERIRLALATMLEASVVADIDPYGGIVGVARRVAEGGCIDLAPQSWRDAARARVVGRRTALGSAIVAGLALVGLLVLHGGPFVYSMLTGHLRDQMSARSRSYKAVCDIRDRIALVKSYGDRARSALELLKLTSDSLVEGSSCVLTSFRFSKGGDVRISGTAGNPGEVYVLKENLDKARSGEDRLFAEVVLTGPSKTKDQYKFDIVARFPQPEEQK